MKNNKYVLPQSIKEFENFDELHEFFLNPVLQEQRKLDQSNGKLDGWDFALKGFLELYVQNIKPKEFQINYTPETGVVFTSIVYKSFI